MFCRKLAVKKQTAVSRYSAFNLSDQIYVNVYIFSFYYCTAYFHGYILCASYYTSYFAIEGVKKISLAVTQSLLVFRKFNVNPFVQQTEYTTPVLQKFVCMKSTADSVTPHCLQANREPFTRSCYIAATLSWSIFLCHSCYM